MNQESLGNTETPKTNQESQVKIVKAQEPLTPRQHDERGCNGTCEVSWKPVKVIPAR